MTEGSWLTTYVLETSHVVKFLIWFQYKVENNSLKF